MLILYINRFAEQTRFEPLKLLYKLIVLSFFARTVARSWSAGVATEPKIRK